MPVRYVVPKHDCEATCNMTVQFTVSLVFCPVVGKAGREIAYGLKSTK